MKKKTILFSMLILMLILLCSCTKDDEYPVVKTNTKPKEEPKLTEVEIREVMDQYFTIEELLFDAASFDLEAGEPDYVDAQVEKVVKKLPPQFATIASKRFIEEQVPEELYDWINSNGEVGLLPTISLDARMQITKNTPSKITIKTFQLGNESYRIGGNVYITAVMEKDRWLIDQVEFVASNIEPLQLKKGEVLTYLQDTRDGINKLKFIASDVWMNSTTEREEPVLIYRDIKNSSFLSYSTLTGDFHYEMADQYNYLPKYIEWNSYHNDRFGFVAPYPSTWTIGEEPTNGDGITLYQGNDGEISVYGTYMLSVDDEMMVQKGGKYAKGFEDVEEIDSKIVYKGLVVRDDFFFYIYANGSKEFYDKHKEIIEYIYKNTKFN